MVTMAPNMSKCFKPQFLCISKAFRCILIIIERSSKVSIIKVSFFPQKKHNGVGDRGMENGRCWLHVIKTIIVQYNKEFHDQKKK